MEVVPNNLPSQNVDFRTQDDFRRIEGPERMNSSEKTNDFNNKINYIAICIFAREVSRAGEAACAEKLLQIL